MTPVTQLLHIWPESPLSINSGVIARRHPDSEDSLDNVIAALEHRDRVRHIHISELTSSEFERIITAMDQPYPALRDLRLLSPYNQVWPIPDTFLNGSAPSLQHLTLSGI
jgi:hypothetical protein